MKTKIFAIVAMVILATAACLGFHWTGQKSEGRGKESVSRVVTCRLAYTAKGYYAPQILAASKGWFNAPGVRVEPVRLGMSAGIAAAEALVSGGADIAAMGDVPGLIALASPRDCVLICAYGGGEKMHSIVVGAGSAINAPSDLSGRRVGVQFGSSTHGAFHLYLDRHSVDDSSVIIVNMPQKDMIEALISGSVDAIAVSEPTPMMALRRVSGFRVLDCLSGMGNDYPSVLVASRAFADSHPEAIRAVVEGVRQGVAWIMADPAGAAVATATVTGAPAEVEEAMFRVMDWRVRLDDGVISSLQKTAEFLVKRGKLKELPDIGALARPEFIEPSGQVEDGL